MTARLLARVPGRRGAAAAGPVVLAGLALLAACASAGTPARESQGEARSGPEEHAASVTIRVVNQGMEARRIRVYVVSSGGGRELLGSVSAHETRTFEYESVRLRSATLRVLARTTSGRELVSSPFTLTDVSEIEWSVHGPGGTTEPGLIPPPA